MKLLYYSEFAKRVSCVSCLLECSTCPRAHVPTCQKRASYSFLPANVPTLSSKSCTNFSTIFEKKIQFLDFSIMLNICKFQEYLSNSRKFISWNKEFNFEIWISLRKNLINLKEVVFSGALGIYRPMTGLV